MNQLDIKNIVFDLELETKNEVIEYLASLIEKNGYVSDYNKFLSSVFEREEIISTGIGGGIAIPHGKDNSVLSSTIAVAKLNKPIDWQSHDDQKVDLVFLLAIEANNDGNEHMRMLADLSTKLMDDDFVDEIKKSRTVKEIHKKIGGIA